MQRNLFIRRLEHIEACVLPCCLGGADPFANQPRDPNDVLEFLDGTLEIDCVRCNGA